MNADESHIPKRFSLVAQTAEILRGEIRKGAWDKQLPGELALCQRLQVSRVTLRVALQQLQREGLLSSGQGRRRKIITQSPRAKPTTTGNTVVFLTPVPLQHMQQFFLFLIDELREHLAKDGWHLDVQISHLAHIKKPASALNALRNRLSPAGWVLFQSTQPMQEWFSQQGIPCVISGSRYPNVSLPAVDIDYRAISYHAAGQFRARGHRRMALINPQESLAGDRESETGFREGAKAGNPAGIHVDFIHHDNSPAGLCAKLDYLFRQPEPPTALLVSRPPYVLTTLTHLHRCGLRIPEDIALISRDDDPFLQHVVPTVARYSTDTTLFARKLCRTVLEAVRNGVIHSRDYRLMPHFLPGETLGLPVL